MLDTEKTKEQLLDELAQLRQQVHELEQRERSPELFQNFMNNSPIAAFIKDEEGRYLYANPRLEQIFLRPLPELLGKTDFELLPYATAQQYRTNDLIVLSNGQPRQVLETLLQEDGKHTYTVFKFPFPNANGQQLLVGIAIDVTEQMQAEQALHESEEWARLAIQVARLGGWRLHLDSNLVEMDERMREIWGVSKATVLVPLPDVIERLHPDDRDRVSAAVSAAIDPQSTGIYEIEYRIVWDDGMVRWVLAMGQVQFEGKGKSRRAVDFFGTLLDITDRKQAETALRQREQEFRTLVENTPDIIVRYDREYHHLYINPSIERALGIPPEQFMGKTGVEMGFTDETSTTWYATVQQVFETGQSRSLEYKFPNPDGELRHYQAHFVPELVDENRITTVVGVARDVTEYKQAENSLRQGEERLRLAMEAAQMGMWDVDLSTGRAVWSDQHFTMLGYEPTPNGEATEQMWYSRIHPEDVERVHQAWQQTRRDRTFYQTEYRIIRADNGEIAWLAALGNFTFDQAGQAIRSIGVLLDITNRKQIENKLRESEQRLQLAQQAGRIGTWEWNLQTNEVSWSDGIWSLLDLEPHSVTPTVETFTHFIHPDDRAQAFAGVEAAIAHGNDHYNEFRVIRQDGQICWFISKGQVIRTADGHPVRLIGVNIDITDRKQTEAALAESNQTLQALVQACPLAIAGFRADGIVRIWNPAAERIFGWSQEEVIGNFLPTVPENRRDEFLQNLTTTIQGQCLAGVETRRQRKGNILFDVALWTAPVDEALAGISCISVIADITERKQAEANLRESREWFRALADNIAQFAWMADEHGLIFWYNKRWFDYTGTTLEEMEGWGWQQVHHPDHVERVTAKFRQHIETGETWEDTFPLRGKDGQYRWFLSRAVPIRDEHGKVFRWFGTNTDITDRQEAEAEREQLLKREQAAREQAEAANRVKDEFLAVLSHELRTPLNPILGWTKLLRTRPFNQEAADRALETIERNAKLQAQLIEDLLDVSRILQGKVRLHACPVNLIAAIEAAVETVQLSAEAKGIQIHTVLDASMGLVTGDANRLQQIIWNLLSNAVKFTPRGGRVEVKLEAVRGRKSEGTAGPEGEKVGPWENPVAFSPTLTSSHPPFYAQINVSDTGQGISPNFLPYVFEYFRQEDSSTTRQFGGLGLGLAIVRHLVELHGGTVSAESAGYGKGATFTVSLPLVHSVAESKLEGLPPQVTADLTGISILVVDDEADMRNLIQFILEEQGASVQVAASATEAMQHLSQAIPDVLISDIGMPETDGYTLMQQVRAMLSQSRKTIPTSGKDSLIGIALTAYAGESNQQQALSAGFQTHLAKPIEPEHLVETIMMLMKH